MCSCCYHCVQYWFSRTYYCVRNTISHLNSTTRKVKRRNFKKQKSEWNTRLSCDNRQCFLRCDKIAIKTYQINIYEHFHLYKREKKNRTLISILRLRCCVSTRDKSKQFFVKEFEFRVKHQIQLLYPENAKTDVKCLGDVILLKSTLSNSQFSSSLRTHKYTYTKKSVPFCLVYLFIIHMGIFFWGTFFFECFYFVWKTTI